MEREQTENSNKILAAAVLRQLIYYKGVDIFMKKRIFASALALTMIFSANVMAANEITVNVNGVKVQMDQQPIIENGRTLVPLRAVAEALGCEVVWDSETKTASFTQGDIMAIVTVGENYIIVGDGVYNENVPVDSPAVIVNSRTMIPLRALSEGFGYDVEWDGSTSTVNINSKAMDSNDTNAADEQEKADNSSNIAGKVDAYAQILNGTVSIIDAVGYTSDEYTELKNELNDISRGISGMSYDELVNALSRLKEIDESLGTVAGEAGVSDVVSNYNSQLQEQLNVIMNS